MNAQERDQLQQFLAALRQQQAQAKDPVADALIRDALSSQADASYWLVQRAMALSVALQAAQNRLQQLQALSVEPNAEAKAEAKAQTVADSAPRPSGNPNAQARASLSAPPSLWMRGLAGQVGGTALGVATGVVAGGVLLQGLQALWGDDAAPNAAVLGSTSADGLSSLSSDGDADLWDLGEDWA